MLAEARALARFSHPNLLPVHEVGVHDGIPYIVSELVDGGSVRDWLGQPHRADEALALVIAAGRGVAEAHRRGMVHRDLKPENVLVGSDGRPRVADFGLAHAFDGAADGAHGAAAGTPAYMAPEQLAGARGDPRSDQYAFAVLAFEVLFGAYPTERADTTVAADHPLAAAAPAITRALAARADARWPSMDALLDALDDAARAPARRRQRRRRLAVLAVAAVVLAAAAIVLALRPGDAPAPAPAPDTERALYEEVAPLIQAGQFDACADHLAPRAHTDALRRLWLQCAAESKTSTRLAAACAAWTRSAPATVPPDCAADLIRARTLQAAGDHRGCAELLLAAPLDPARSIILARCVGQLDDGELRWRQCVHLQRFYGHASPETACGTRR